MRSSGFWRPEGHVLEVKVGGDSWQLSVCLSVSPGLRNSTPTLLPTSVNRQRAEAPLIHLDVFFFFSCVNIVGRSEGCQRTNLGTAGAAWVGLRCSFCSTRLTLIHSGQRLSDT